VQADGLPDRSELVAIGAHPVDLVGVEGQHLDERISGRDRVPEDLDALDGPVEVRVVEVAHRHGHAVGGARDRPVQRADGVGVEQHVLVELHAVGRGALVEHQLGGGAEGRHVVDDAHRERAVLPPQQGQARLEARRPDREHEHGHGVGEVRSGLDGGRR
jgi:hypothetical protein